MLCLDHQVNRSLTHPCPVKHLSTISQFFENSSAKYWVWENDEFLSAGARIWHTFMPMFDPDNWDWQDAKADMEHWQLFYNVFSCSGLWSDLPDVFFLSLAPTRIYKFARVSFRYSMSGFYWRLAMELFSFPLFLQRHALHVFFFPKNLLSLLESTTIEQNGTTCCWIQPLFFAGFVSC